MMKSITAVLLIALLGAFGIISCTSKKDTKPQPVLGTRSATIIEKDGLKFRDLNKNGELDNT